MISDSNYWDLLCEAWNGGTRAQRGAANLLMGMLERAQRCPYSWPGKQNYRAFK